MAAGIHKGLLIPPIVRRGFQPPGVTQLSDTSGECLDRRVNSSACVAGENGLGVSPARENEHDREQ